MGLSSPPHVDTVYFYDILCTYENGKILQCVDGVLSGLQH